MADQSRSGRRLASARRFCIVPPTIRSRSWPPNCPSFRPARAPDGARRPHRAVSRRLRQIWPAGASPGSQCTAQTGPSKLERQQPGRPEQAVDPADRAAETALLPRFPAEISRLQANAPFHLSQRRSSRRGRRFDDDRRSRRNAVLLLFEHGDRTEFRGVPERLRRPEHVSFLRDEGQFQSGGAARRLLSSAPAWTWSAREN